MKLLSLRVVVCLFFACCLAGARRFESDKVSADYTCDRIDRCSCRDSRTGKVVSLHALSGADLPTFHVKDQEHTKYTYYYDPCRDFTRSGAGSCQNVAVCQEDGDTKLNYNIGFGNTAYFETNFSALAVTYSGEPSGGDPRTDGPQDLRTANTTVYLQCDKKGTVNESKLSFYTEAPIGEYFFTLTSLCACPGACPGPDQPSCLAEGPKDCSCRLTSNGELVNIESLDKPNSPLTAKSGDDTVYFNPCTAISSVGGCAGATVCVYSADTKAYTAYGSPGTGNYSVDEQGNVTLTYTAQSRGRHAAVRLICDPTQRQAPLFKAVTVLASSVVMEIHYICACPGQCLPPPVLCQSIDTCSCKLSQNLGMINLHHLDNPVAPLQAHTQSYTFYYNPCSSFSVVGTQGNCESVAACQLDPAKRDWSLGLQKDVTFHVAQVNEEHVVSLVYTGGTDKRQVTIKLRCNPTVATSQLEFQGENPYENYHLVLEGKDVCPQNSTALAHGKTLPIDY